MSSFNRPPRPFQFPAYDPQADYAPGAGFGRPGAALDAFARGDDRAFGAAHARAYPPPQDAYSHGADSYATDGVIDPHEPTHSWLDLELIPSWLRPFTLDANTRFTRTPDLYLRPREAEAEAEVAIAAATETAPAPDISSRSWHFVLDPTDDDPVAAPFTSHWSEPPAHPADTAGVTGEACSDAATDWDRPAFIEHGLATPPADAEPADTPLPHEQQAPADVMLDGTQEQGLPQAEALASGFVPEAAREEAPAGSLQAPVMDAIEAGAPDCAFLAEAEAAAVAASVGLDSGDAVTGDGHAAAPAFAAVEAADHRETAAAPTAVDPDTSVEEPLAPHMAVLGRLVVIGRAALPPAPASDQDIAAAATLAPPAARDDVPPPPEAAGDGAAPWCDATANAPDARDAQGQGEAEAAADAVGTAFLDADGTSWTPAVDDSATLEDAAPFEDTAEPVVLTEAYDLAPAAPFEPFAADVAQDASGSDADAMAWAAEDAAAFPADTAPPSPPVETADTFEGIAAEPAFAEANAAEAMAMDDAFPLLADTGLDGAEMGSDVAVDPAIPVLADEAPAEAGPAAAQDLAPPATGTDDADASGAGAVAAAAAPLASPVGIASLWSPYQQVVTAHFLGGAAPFAPAAPLPAAPAPVASHAPVAQQPSLPAEAAVADTAGEVVAGYDLPPLDLLREPPVVEPDYELSEEFLDQSSTMLQQVLRDFGVRGEIIDANPGPVVTLYEFEPAPGVKSSRVIGLSPDIARSMSAISARVAVVEGRNVIGIELPNRRRETVWLRELLASHEFAEARPKLGLCLGKTIGGAPVIADLARMPHLLVAGTTGSGKSVAINTMILSLLYRHTPEACRLIMIDPKMLELSIYEGIPHLLTPVVTDPKKAIIALKWAVKEMEERYKKMSRLAVRNIDGYNARVKEAAEKGEVITRNVQVGFDKETGEALFEEQEMDLTPLPYIVVIVDEMADLMMVAGKEIEGAIQRLAQMARAAGIHLVMATQRPSVDVITGTIKANFPTRISFQVTSKIDSRTILGEMGAETLLGQGDMLFMAGGGRITRVHGPFVSDAEVEHVVSYLKAQGGPDYLDAVVLDEDAEADDEDEAVFDRSGLGEAGGDLYEQAVAIVMRDRKASTSYIQRRLQVGYNKAASLMERMETEGIVGPANHAGKREILTFSRPG